MSLKNPVIHRASIPGPSD